MRRAFALGVPLAFLAAACTYDNGDAHRALNDNTQPASCYTPTQSTIDTDAQLAIDAGIGAGVFIEYASGGHYHVRTACDTTRSNSACNWDIIITPETGKTISNPASENLSGGDTFLPYQGDASGSYQLTAQTSAEVDGVTFDIDPGSAITVDAFLDGTCALPFFFWVGDGAVHQGVPSNPLTLQPTPE
jgi:hypothetical protein